MKGSEIKVGIIPKPLDSMGFQVPSGSGHLDLPGTQQTPDSRRRCEWSIESCGLDGRQYDVSLCVSPVTSVNQLLCPRFFDNLWLCRRGDAVYHITHPSCALSWFWGAPGTAKRISLTIGQFEVEMRLFGNSLRTK